MESVLHGVIVYFLLLITFRVSGKRSLSENSTFDFVLLLLISGTVQEWLVSNDPSLTNSVILTATLAGLNIALSLLKHRFLGMAKIFDGVPTLLVENGKLLHEPMRRTRLGVADILAAGREMQGLERMEQIKYAILETSGIITIIPEQKQQAQQKQQDTVKVKVIRRKRRVAPRRHHTPAQHLPKTAS